MFCGFSSLCCCCRAIKIAKISTFVHLSCPAQTHATLNVDFEYVMKNKCGKYLFKFDKHDRLSFGMRFLYGKKSENQKHLTRPPYVYSSQKKFYSLLMKKTSTWNDALYCIKCTVVQNYFYVIFASRSSDNDRKMFIIPTSIESRLIGIACKEIKSKLTR